MKEIKIHSLYCPFCPVGWVVPQGYPDIHDLAVEAGVEHQIHNSWTAVDSEDLPGGLWKVIKEARTGKRAWAHYTQTWLDGEGFAWTVNVDPPYDRIARKLSCLTGKMIAPWEEKVSLRAEALGYDPSGEYPPHQAVLGLRTDIEPFDSKGLRASIMRLLEEECLPFLPLPEDTMPAAHYLHPAYSQLDPRFRPVGDSQQAAGPEDSTDSSHNSTAPAFSLRMVVSSDLPLGREYARQIRASLARGGYEVEILFCDYWRAYQLLARGESSLFLISLPAGIDPTVHSYCQLYNSDGMYNYAALSSREIDKCCLDLRRAASRAEIVRAARRLNRVLHELAACRPLFLFNRRKTVSTEGNSAGSSGGDSAEKGRREVTGDCPGDNRIEMRGLRESTLIREITIEDAAYGVVGLLSPWQCVFPYPRRGMSPSYPFWSEMINRYGTMGLLLEREKGLEKRVEGMVTFLPKKTARKIGYTACATDRDLDKTLVIICLNVGQRELRQGRALKLLKAVDEYAGKKGYLRLESPAAAEELAEQKIRWQSAGLFRGAGYRLDPTTEGPFWTPLLFYKLLEQKLPGQQ